MRTTLDLPADLLKEAQKAAHARTKTETIVLGLQEIIRKKKIHNFLAAEGKFPDLYVDIDKSRGRK